MADEEQIVKLQGTRQELMQLIPQLKMMYQLFEANLDRGLYTIPVTTFQDHYTFAPQIKLAFYQLRNETRDGLPRVHGEICYRVVGETEETFTPTNARVRAERIRNLFTQPDLFVWQKGKDIASYRDRKNGWDFKLYVKNEAEARKIITQVMAIENKVPDWSNLRISVSRASYPEITAQKRIYGEQRRLPRRRPLEDIKFRYAELHLWGIAKPIALVDTLGTREEPLIRVV
ncbi:hypothetical protein [Gloeocapsopsis dulcis]|uniref:Uncharacterized protein n=1 Tax=Gloeocapsopsis dulcis AAB1 = 1H9 TaxID=1433147 RepID=A0A6N8G4Z4_9CHRO|nr:hypothetical protein [Gloeocapsopsis dulcis]MUL39345.1 hypothetical protein [Gloeocapsopsis dulcis AAB1 = 1H9]WNN89699.1 hypothetical protein P0S91_00960 [Gloeocapsopsis dulcis]